MKRHPANPIITREHIASTHPSLRDVSSVFNPGGIMHEGKFLLLLRVQNRARETFLCRAISSDGIQFRVDSEPVTFSGMDACRLKVYHIYDPRITCLDGAYHIVTAMDTDQGCFLAAFGTSDFSTLHFQGLVSEPDVRNGVLFADKIDGCYFRFERPNRHQMADGVKTGSVITCSTSSDLRMWECRSEVMRGKPHYWDELIGSGPPPLKTRHGWLHIYHGVATHFGSSNIYQAGISLHSLNAPWQVIARGKYNILEPREIYELTGQVPNVVFPSAAIPLYQDADGCVDDDTPVYVYYGAADTCVCLAISSVSQLLEELYAR